LFFIPDLVQQHTLVTDYLVKQLHELIFRGNDPENAECYLSYPVMISSSRHLPPQPWQLPILMQDCCHWYDETKSLKHPVTLADFASEFLREYLIEFY
jgi:Fic family protein